MAACLDSICRSVVVKPDRAELNEVAFHGLMSLPEAVWELSLGIYLVVKGYRRDAPVFAVDAPVAMLDSPSAATTLR
jgi:hypothetical protein